MRRGRLILFACLFMAAMPRSAAAESGHGPVFGNATPTLGRGGWQLDQAWMARIGRGVRDDEQMLRTMISVGLTEDIQVSGSLPITLDASVFMPRARMMAMMSSNQDLEGIVAWRFQRRALGAGARLESTAFFGASAPMQAYRPDGMKAAPSLHASFASGYASRTHYFWVGAGAQRYFERSGDRVGDSATYSLVYGYRPPAMQWDYPKPDLRFFVEIVGEHASRGEHRGFPMLTSGGDTLLIGPTTLLLYKSYGLSGGILFPLHQKTNGQPEERFRFAANFSYFFWRK
jgi:hypothetical protein